MQTNTKRLTTLAMLAALSIITMLFIRVPMFLPFLFYDPKDVIIIIGGFMYGPIAAFTIIVVVSFVEMITVSDSGAIGLLMNILSSAAIVMPAVLIYSRWRNLPGAIVGLIIGGITTTAVMLLWNYLIIPLYMAGVTRDAVMPMLVPIFLPFNLIKSGLNAALVMLLYKPITIALGQAGLYKPVSPSASSKLNKLVLIVSAFVILTLILIILAERGVF